jgi:hypothetical protein
VTTNDSYANAHEAEDGYLVTGGPFFTGGTASPVGLDLPVATIYVQTLSTGVVLWKHNSATASDWSPITSEIFSAAPPPMVVTHNGTMSANQLVGYSNLTNIPIVVGFRSRLNRVSSASEAATHDYALDFFSGIGDGGNNNGFHRHTITNASSGISIVSGGPTFEAGDRLSIYYRDTGDNASDLCLGLFFEAVPA